MKVADFGIGKLLSGGDGDLTRTGQMLGSPAYMSPGADPRREARRPLGPLLARRRVLRAADRVAPLSGRLDHDARLPDPPHGAARSARAARGSAAGHARRLRAAARQAAGEAARRRGGFLREIRRIEVELRGAAPTQAMTVSSGGPSPPAGRRSRRRRRRPTCPPTASPGPAGRCRPSLPGGTATGARGGALYLFGAAALLRRGLSLLVWIWRASTAEEERLAAAGRDPRAAARRLSWRRRRGGSAEPTATPATDDAADARGAADARALGRRRRDRRSDTAGERRAPRGRAVGHAPGRADAAPRPTRGADGAGAGGFGGERLRGSSGAGRRRRPTTCTGRAASRSSPRAPTRRALYVDGHYAGIADDWDDRGGGTHAAVLAEGTHRVRLELPGYRNREPRHPGHAQRRRRHGRRSTTS